MIKKDYERWEKEKLYLFTGYLYAWENADAPQKGSLYTRDEAIEFLKKNKYYKNEDFSDSNKCDNWLKDENFITVYDKRSEYLEEFYQEFTTPSGETIVAFGEYGYNG
jgi:hypothetical protein